MRSTRRCGSEQDTTRPKQAPGVVPGVTPKWMTPCFGLASLEKSLKIRDPPKLMVVGPHPLSNPANWVGFCCQWLLQRTAETSNLTGGLSEADGATHQKLLATVQIRISHLNRRPHFFHNTTWLWDENTPSWSTTNSFGRKPVDTKHLGQKQLAARWGLSEATLERWRSEGIGPMYLKLLGRVCYRLCDIEEFESSCLRTPTAKQAA